MRRFCNWRAKGAYALAIDLPGIGGSEMPNAPSTKLAIADCIHELVQTLALKHLTLVGHDVGGQVAFAYLSRYGHELERAVITDVVIPGLKPWEDVIRNPHIWHFSFHSVPDLPEKLVAGKQREYFEFFYNILTAHPERITAEARDSYAKAYASPSALSTGFNWYRAFAQDAKDNSSLAASGADIQTPLLYLRGDHEGGAIEQYVAGFNEVGIRHVQSSIIPDCGHYAPEEQPDALWERIATFMKTEAVQR